MIIRKIGGGGGGASEYLAPLFDATRVGTGITLSAGNSIATTTGPSGFKAAYLTVPTAGRVYGEVVISAITGSTNSALVLFDDDPAGSGTPVGRPATALPAGRGDSTADSHAQRLLDRTPTTTFCSSRSTPTQGRWNWRGTTAHMRLPPHGLPRQGPSSGGSGSASTKGLGRPSACRLCRSTPCRTGYVWFGTSTSPA
jgi:hypothetical protein